VLAAAVLVATAGAPATAGPTSRTSGKAPSSGTAAIAAQVAQLDRDVTRVSDELAAGAAAYEAAQGRLARLTQDAFAARDAAEAREADTAERASSLGGLARAAYKGGVPPLVTALMSGDPRLVADLAYVQRSVDHVAVDRRAQVRAAYLRQAGAGRALEQSDADRSAALVQREALDTQLRELAATAERLTAELTATAARLEQARAQDRARARAAAAREAQRLAALAAAAARRSATSRGATAPVGAATGTGTGVPTGSGAGCQPPGPYGEANGFLSTEGLCALSVGRGHRLRTDAARAFEQMNALHVAQTGGPLCVTDSYRSYAAQVDVFKRKPALAVIPGRSNHGWGVALDLCGGIQTFGTPGYRWMWENAPQFGWVHPPWAQRGGSRPEPWHWEYVGTAGRR